MVLWLRVTSKFFENGVGWRRYFRRMNGLSVFLDFIWSTSRCLGTLRRKLCCVPPHCGRATANHDLSKI